MNNKHRRSSSTASNIQPQSDFPTVDAYCKSNGIHDPGHHDLPYIAAAACLADKEFAKYLPKHARPAELAHLNNAVNLVMRGDGPCAVFRQLALSEAECAFVLRHAVQYGPEFLDTFAEPYLMAMEAVSLLKPVSEATSFKTDYETRHRKPGCDTEQTTNKLALVQTYADGTRLLIYATQINDPTLTIHFFTQNCSTFGLWLGKPYRNSDDEYVVSARDLAILAAIQSPLCDDTEFRAWLCQYWVLGVSAFEKYMQPISRSEWRLLLNNHQPCNIDKRYLDHAANKPDMIAEYILTRLTALTLNGIEKLIAKMYPRKVKERAPLIDQLRVLVSLFPNGCGTHESSEDAEEVKALREQLRDVFVKAGVLPQSDESSGDVA